MRVTAAEAKPLVRRQDPQVVRQIERIDREATRAALTRYGYTFKSKLELAYADRLQTLYGPSRWRYEPITFHLPGGVKFTPDFQILGVRWEMDFHEVKPKVRLGRERDSIVRLKVAAATFTEFNFFLVRGGRGVWEIERVKS